MNIDYLCYDKSKEISQCFLIRKNKLKTYELYNVLFQFCKTDLQVNANLKKTYRFYRESRKMPWFWNDDGYFDSLDGNPSDLIGIFHFSENNSLLYGETMKRSSSFFNYGDIKENFTEKNWIGDMQ